jgi:hypothetical protein
MSTGNKICYRFIILKRDYSKDTTKKLLKKLIKKLAKKLVSKISICYSTILFPYYPIYLILILFINFWWFHGRRLYKNFNLLSKYVVRYWWKFYGFHTKIWFNFCHINFDIPLSVSLYKNPKCCLNMYTIRHGFHTQKKFVQN